MAPRYKVTLTREERKDLEAISTKGKRAARTVLYARALLLLNAGEYGPKWLVANVAEALGTTPRSIEKLKKKFVEEGLPDAIERKKRIIPPREIQFGGDFKEKLIALACTDPPEGRKRWTVRLLAEKLVELNIVPSVSPMTVCNTLKKMNLSLTSADTGKFRRTKAQRSYLNSRAIYNNENEYFIKIVHKQFYTSLQFNICNEVCFSQNIVLITDIIGFISISRYNFPGGQVIYVSQVTGLLTACNGTVVLPAY